MGRKLTLQIIIIVALVIGYGIYNAVHSQRPAQSAATQGTGSQPTSAVLGAQTKTTGCSVRGALPDPDCTPGAAIPTATTADICKSGYASSVRNVPAGTKAKVYREYGITSHPTGSYEVDHLVSLELGGSNDIANLWPEAAEPAPGFHEKDVVENYLHGQVCSGKMTLSTAQQEISTNWLNIYSTVK